ncbi:MAG: hypothetical protein IJU79_04235 [Desulfovibrionaceae bacterium]|nr:hypothetical protein [Desulfovibrionaceae bacterium]
MQRRTFLCTLGVSCLSLCVPQITFAASKALVVYFSKTGEQYGVGVISKGNTAIVAEMIAKKTSADLSEITRVDDTYPKTYQALCDVAKDELTKKVRPKYSMSITDLSGYQTIFIGAPVWWGDWPMVMYSFFEQANLAGKMLIPFCTHEGSGLSEFDKKLAKACPKSRVGQGLAIVGRDAQKHSAKVDTALDGWLKKLAAQGVVF